MFKKIINALLATILTTLCCLPLGNNASAAGRSFAISPMSQRVILMPGEVYRGAITVAVPNASSDDFNYLVSVAPYSTQKNEITDTDFGGSDFETMTNYNQIVNWITLDNPEGTVKPNEQKTVSFTINVPTDVPAGGQYAALLVREDTSKQEDDSGMAIKEIMQMSHIIYAEVAGETRKEAEIINNSIPSIILSNNLQTPSTVKNNGNVHTEAEYTIQIWTLFSDEELYTNEEDPKKILIMPGTTKYHNQEFTLPSIGIFRVKQTVKIFGETSEIEKIVFVCPVWLLFIVIFAIMFAVFWLISKSKKRKQS